MSKKHDCDNPNCYTKNMPAVRNYTLPEGWETLDVSFKKPGESVRVCTSFDLCPICVNQICQQLKIPIEAPEKKTNAQVLWKAVEGLIQEEVGEAIEDEMANR